MLRVTVATFAVSNGLSWADSLLQCLGQVVIKVSSLSIKVFGLLEEAGADNGRYIRPRVYQHIMLQVVSLRFLPYAFFYAAFFVSNCLLY